MFYKYTSQNFLHLISPLFKVSVHLFHGVPFEDTYHDFMKVENNNNVFVNIITAFHILQDFFK